MPTLPFPRIPASLKRWLSGLLLALAATGPALAESGLLQFTPFGMPGQVGFRAVSGPQWTHEVVASYAGASRRELTLNSLDWRSLVRLTSGIQPFDVALCSQLTRRRDSEGTLQVGPTIRGRVGTVQLQSNLVFEQRWGPTDQRQLKYQWQALQRLQPRVRLGFQALGELVPGEHAADRHTHRAGPLLSVGLMNKLELQAAYLRGTASGNRQEQFSAQLLMPY